jgi:hypothetical protein
MLVKVCPPSCSRSLKETLDFRYLPVCQVLKRENVDSPENIAPEKIPFLKYAPVTSRDAERAFSAYKHILSDKRQLMTPENMEKILIAYCASKSQ